MLGRWWDTKMRMKPAFRMLSSPNTYTRTHDRQGYGKRSVQTARLFVGAWSPGSIIRRNGNGTGTRQRCTRAAVGATVQARGLQGFKDRYRYRGASHQQVDVALVRPGNEIGPRRFGYLSRGSRIATGGSFLQQLHGLSILLCEINQWCDPCGLGQRKVRGSGLQIGPETRTRHACSTSVRWKMSVEVILRYHLIMRMYLERPKLSISGHTRGSGHES